MLQYFRDLYKFNNAMKKPAFDTYFEAYHLKDPFTVIRVLVNECDQRGIAYTDPELREVKYEPRAGRMFQARPVQLTSRLEHDVYEANWMMVANHLEKIVELARLKGMSYPVFIDRDKHTWYIAPHSMISPSDDFSVQLFCPTRHPSIMTVKWSHGPFQWLFYENGHVTSELHEEYWLTNEALFTPIA